MREPTRDVQDQKAPTVAPDACGGAADASGAGDAEAVRVVHVEVRRDRIAADVVVSEERFVLTTQRLIEAVLPQYPHLLEHACVNERGTTFAAVARCTSVPHLLEHMAIENQVRAEELHALDAASESLPRAAPPSHRIDGALADQDGGTPAKSWASSALPTAASGVSGKKPVTYLGKTSWTDRMARKARIELSFADDLTALAALRDATRDLNAALMRTVRRKA